MSPIIIPTQIPFYSSPSLSSLNSHVSPAPGGGDSGIDLGLCSIHEECNHGGKCDSGFCVCSSGWTGTFCNDRQAIVLPKFDVVVGFIIITIASWFIGDQLSTLRLPLITGYIFTGILAGPHILNLIPEEQIRDLDFIDHIALAFIAFAAGSKLYLRGLQGRVHSVMIVTAGLVVVDYMLGFCMCLALASQVKDVGMEYFRVMLMVMLMVPVYAVDVTA